LLRAVAKSGADVLSVDWRIDLAEARAKLGPGIALQGNVDPAVLFAPAEKVLNVTRQTAEALGGIGHILNLGHGILQGTPVENARLFIETGQRVEFAETKGAAPSR
jgi:uroporphyrinogen decarboxylase